jgi:general secretion pathway protein D
MTRPLHSRATAVSRIAAVFTILCISIVAAAQSAPVPPQQPSEPAATPSATAAAITPLPSKRNAAAAEDAYIAGARLLDRKDFTAAETEFAKAAKLNPANHEYAVAAALAHEHRVTDLVQQSGKARILGQNAKAESLLAQARTLDPQNNIVTQHADPGALPIAFNPQIEPWLQEGPTIAGPITLMPATTPQTFHLNSDPQDVVRSVITSYGIRPVFDQPVQGPRIRFDLENVTYQQAVPILFSMAHLFAVPLDAKSVIIAKDTPENRQRLERLLEETIYVPGMSTEQMTELGNIVRNVFDVKQVAVQNNANSLIIRAPEAILTPVNLTLADLIDGTSQVMIDIQLFAVDKTHSRNIGTQLPQQIGVYSVAGAAYSIVQANQALINQAIAQGLILATASDIVKALFLIASGAVQSSLLTNTIGFFGGGLTQFGVTINAPPTFNLALNSSDSRALDDVQVRVGDRQSATFRAGTRYPITTSTYSTGPLPTASQLAGVTINGISAASLLNNISSVTIPQIQYEDLGLTLKATPTIQKSGEISMKLDLKIEALAGSALNNIPILANRQYVSDVTVKDGETALLVSTLTRQESSAVNGIPGLGELPGFQVATADKTVETDSSELVIIITPHVVLRRSSVVAGPRIAVNLPQQPN